MSLPSLLVLHQHQAIASFVGSVVGRDTLFIKMQEFRIESSAMRRHLTSAANPSNENQSKIASSRVARSLHPVSGGGGGGGAERAESADQKLLQVSDDRCRLVICSRCTRTLVSSSLARRDCTALHAERWPFAAVDVRVSQLRRRRRGWTDVKADVVPPSESESESPFSPTPVPPIGEDSLNHEVAQQAFLFACKEGGKGESLLPLGAGE